MPLLKDWRKLWKITQNGHAFRFFHRFNISHSTLFHNCVKISKCQITGKLLISALWIHKNRENDQFLPSFWPWCGQHDQDNSGYIITNIIKTYFRSSLTPKSAMNRVSFGGNKDFKAIRISVVYLNYIKIYIIDVTPSCHKMVAKHYSAIFLICTWINESILIFHPLKLYKKSDLMMLMTLWRHRSRIFVTNTSEPEIRFLSDIWL